MNGIHGAVGRCRIFKKDCHQSGVVRIKYFPKLIRQNGHGNRRIHQGIVPDHIRNAIHLFNLFFQVCAFLRSHALYDLHRKRSFSKVVHQNVLPDHRINVVRQIIQDIIVDPGLKISQCRRDQEQNA